MTTPCMQNMLKALVAVGTWACVALPLQAQTPEWPSRPIRVIVPNPAGGTADNLPRMLSEALSQRLSQPVVVENRPGAAGNIGAEYVYNAEPDGYTWLAAPPPALTVNPSLYPKLNHDPSKFAPITVMATVPNALFVHPSLPVNTLQEFLAYAKAHPDRLSYASQGNGSTAHLTAELFKLKTGLKIQHVPYKGDAPAVADLLAGHVQVMFGNVAAGMNHVRNGKLRVLAVTSPKRLPAHPQLPTVDEVVPGVVAVTWFGIVAPPRTPVTITRKVAQMVSDILKTPEMIRKYTEAGADPVGNTPEEMDKWMREDAERWRAVIRAAQIKID
ncbi:MAG: tripartite tricarboxylate transporter substrate binding protein [Limnohabitans sp.]|nr:tripartite tricarboxylate transporter substrate binding protein [Limnohabitans sp.]